MISIIIPTLNEEKLLPNLLEQLSQKSLREKFEYEIIVSDGGSFDKTLKIANEFADKVVVNDPQKHQNIGMGRNAGADSAEGEVFVFINGDVEVDNIYNFLSVIKEKFIPSNFLAMTCSVKVFRNEVKFIDKVFYTFYNNYFHILNIIGVGMGRGECQVIRADIFKEMQGYNPELAAGEDFDLYKRIRKKGKIYFNRDIVIFESPRRYRKFGHFRILFRWLINSIFVIFKNKSHADKWEQVR